MSLVTGRVAVGHLMPSHDCRMKMDDWHADIILGSVMYKYATFSTSNGA